MITLPVFTINLTEISPLVAISYSPQTPLPDLQMPLIVIDGLRLALAIFPILVGVSALMLPISQALIATTFPDFFTLLYSPTVNPVSRLMLLLVVSKFLFNSLT